MQYSQSEHEFFRSLVSKNVRCISLEVGDEYRDRVLTSVARARSSEQSLFFIGLGRFLESTLGMPAFPVHDHVTPHVPHQRRSVPAVLRRRR